MEEYILKTTAEEVWQKWLNQWRHKYELEVVSMISMEPGVVTILLKRTSRG